MSNPNMYKKSICNNQCTHLSLSLIALSKASNDCELFIVFQLFKSNNSELFIVFSSF